MFAALGFLRVSLLASLVLKIHGIPIKGSKNQGSDGKNTGGNFPSDWGDSTGSQTSKSRHPSGVKPVLTGGIEPHPSKYYQAEPVVASSMPGGYAFVPVQPGYVGGPGSAPAYVGSGVVPLQPGSVSGSVPLASEYVASATQSGAAHSSLPETQWAVPPKSFEEAEAAASEAQGFGSNEVELGPSGPILQSGETSNVVKEAELGNYRKQTEEFGYPVPPARPALGFESPLLPMYGMGGFWAHRPFPYPLPYPFPYPYPNFDYRLLYGLYPPGTYSTFSKNHEKGTDHYQSIHYLKEHESDTPANPGSQQKQQFTLS